MKAGQIIQTKLGQAIVLNENVLGSRAMRCILLHRNKSIHRMDEVEVFPGVYAGPWGPVIVLPEYVESICEETLCQQDLIDLAWLTSIREDGYRYEKDGPHPLPKFRSDTQISWNPIHIASVFRSLDELEGND